MELLSLAKNPVPSGPVVGMLPGYDGRPLRYAHWSATRGPRRGTICLFQGRAEFIEKYFETIADLRRRGFAVATLDWRGQGGSYRALDNPRKGHITSFTEYDRDLVRFMKDVVLPDCPPPYYALAHSMGGNILLRNASLPGSWFERLILTGPLLEIHPNSLGYPRPVARIYSEVGCLIGFAKSYVYGGIDAPEKEETFDANVLTSDRERWSRNNAVLEVAPELGLGYPTIGWLRSALRSCAQISTRAYARRLKVPVLLFSAAEDEVVSTRKIEEFAIDIKLSSHIMIPGARHEILHENDGVRQRFWAAFDAYLGVNNSDQ